MMNRAIFTKKELRTLFEQLKANEVQSIKADEFRGMLVEISPLCEEIKRSIGYWYGLKAESVSDGLKRDEIVAELELLQSEVQDYIRHDAMHASQENDNDDIFAHWSKELGLPKNVCEDAWDYYVEIGKM